MSEGPEAPVEVMRGLGKSGIWNVEKADRVISLTGEALQSFIDEETPVEERQLAINTFQEVLDKSRQRLEE